MSSESNNNPYAAPQADLTFAQKTGVDIDSLDMSDKWKASFKAFEQLGGPAMQRMKTLPKAERVALFKASRVSLGSFALAFLFGPFYYIAKGMWKKGIILWLMVTAIVLTVMVVMELVGLGEFSRGVGFGGAAIIAMMSSRDFYAFKVLGDKGWLPVKPW